MGVLLATIDRRWNSDQARPRARRVAGFAALGVLLGAVALATTLLTWIADRNLPLPAAVACLGVLGSACLAQRSLEEHVRAVADALDTSGIEAGRRAVARIVGRDTAVLDEAGVARAAVESLAENFADGIVAPAFWLALAGLPGGMAYKAINTADSMIGHRTPRHAAFGFAAARLDDWVNWPAARLAALLLAAAAALTSDASAREAWRITRRDANGHASPNAGWPEAAMAGALGFRLGGSRTYAGRVTVDRAMGDGEAALDTAAIRRALRLYRTACRLLVASVFALAFFTTALVSER